MARILVISDLWEPFPGGAERYIAAVADALLRRGHEVDVFTTYEKAEPRSGLTIMGQPDIDEESLFYHIYHIYDEPYDAVICHHYFMEKFKDSFAKIPDIPLIEIIHSRDRNPNASFAIFNSQFTANNHGYREGDLVMLPPVDNSCVAIGAPSERQYIGHVKPLYGKGIGLTYRLARIMSDRKFLILRGEWQSLEWLEKLPNVEYMEPVADIREFYARCRMVVMPSLTEDAGTVPLECALNGIPCLSSNAGGLAETNFGGVTLPVEDIKGWLSETCRLDHSAHYDSFVRQQRAFVNGLDWEGKFNVIDKKVRELCAK